ncbi:MAG: NAD-dependent epimerase/dehydratase family protein [Pseudomonadota bacterium]
MRSLITGGAGFIGREVARSLAARGDGPIAVFSRAPSAARLGDLAAHVTPLAGDLGSFSHVLDAVRMARPQIIYHLGALLSVPSEADPATAIQTNAMGTFHVLEAARLFDVRQVVFASSVGTYGHDLPDQIDDVTLQRPVFLYGATKVFGEHLGLFYRQKYGLDFRGIRYPAVVGPGVETKGAVQYTSWMIEKPARGEPFTVWVSPELRTPMMSIGEAARATVALADAPAEAIKTVTYLVDGMKPTPSAAELAAAVRERLPGAQIDFQPNRALEEKLRGLMRPIDDSRARAEWGWAPSDTPEMIVEGMLAQMRAEQPG